MNKTQPRVKRYPVIELKGRHKRPVIKVDFPKQSIDFSRMLLIDFCGSNLDVPDLLGWVYIRFSDNLESFVFASKANGGYLIN